MKKIFLFVFLAVFCVIFWNVVRYIHAAATADQMFGGIVYGISFLKDVCLPAVIGVTVGFLTSLRSR